MLEIGAMKFRLALAVVLLFPFPSHVPMKPSSHGLTRPILLPKGRWEFEQWVTSRWEKEHGTYSVLDFREELEYGLTDDFQIALYLNQYLTVEQAQKAIFPGKYASLRGEQQVWRVSGGGWFVVDEVVGKHEFITYAVGLNSDGSVKQIEVMDYRETYGGEIRNEKWRAQFVGKTIRSTVKLDSDIKNISGATLSALAALTMTGHGLYYAGGERLRA